MREAHPLERTVGVGWYVSDVDGTGGRLRREPDAFRVREVEAVEPAPLDADPGAYPHLLVRATLRGWDTNDFASALSDRLGVSRERVSWAGTKDKHATTTQLLSVRGVDAADLPEMGDATMEAVGRVGRALQFGDLAGNAFEIRVADVEHPERARAVTAALRAVAAGEGPHAGADAHEDDSPAGAGDEADAGTRADANVDTGADAGADANDGHEARVGVPNYFGHQRFGSRRPVTHVVGLHVVRGEWREAVLAYVGNPHGNEPARTRAARERVDAEAASGDPDWAAALEAMPAYLGYERSMLHRLVEGADWREALEAVPSNLQRLFVNAAQSYAFNRVVSRRLARGLPLARPVAGDVVCFADREAPETVEKPDEGRTQRVTERRVETVARHCARGRAFVTAPLVGTDTEFAEGEPGEVERAVLDDLSLSPGDFALPGSFDSSGTRRAVLVRTDLRVRTDPLRFEFALPAGSYATTLLREYLKTSPLEL
jgi:tRNA pseudouridine13 synthase